MGEYTVTPETEPDVEDGLSCFTLENDEIPPGMDQASVPDPSSYGVSSRPSSSNFSYLSASSLSHNEPEITIPKKRRERENSLERLSEYCPEDVASDFFNEEERLPHVHLTPAEITQSSETIDTPEQPSSSPPSQQEPLVVMGETIYGNVVDEDDAELAKSMRLCWRLAFILVGAVALVIVLLFTPAKKAMDVFERRKSNSESAALNVETNPTPTPQDNSSMTPTTLSPMRAPTPSTTPLEVNPTQSPNNSPPTTPFDSNITPSLSPIRTTPAPSPGPSLSPTESTSAPSATPTITPSQYPSSAPTRGGSYGAVHNSPLFTGNQANVEFGTSVSLSDDGTNLAVGSRDNVVNIFAFNGTNWNEKGSPVIGGPHVVISGDGLVVVAGDPTSDSSQGRILTYSYDAVDDKWNARGAALIGTQTTLADSSTGGSQLGSVMALSFDGSVLMTGEPLADQGAGRVKRYESIGGDWIENTDFQVSAPSAGDEMGASLDISPDGSLVAIGSPGGDGKVSTYSFSGSSTSQIGSTVAGGSGDGLGKQVALVENSSGTRVLAALKATGGAFIYRRTGSKWNQAYSSGGGNVFTHLRMGINSNTGKFTVALGYSTCNLVPCLISGETGRVKLLANRQNVNQWGEDGDFEVAPDLNNMDMALDMAHDASILVAGAPGSDDSGFTLSGQIYLFTRTG